MVKYLKEIHFVHCKLYNETTMPIICSVGYGMGLGIWFIGGWDFWKIIEGGSRFSCRNGDMVHIGGRVSIEGVAITAFN